MTSENTIDSEVRLEEARKLMEWERYDEPTLLEYLRYYKSGIIGEVHIEAAIAQEANKARLDELKDFSETIFELFNNNDLETEQIDNELLQSVIGTRIAQLTAEKGEIPDERHINRGVGFTHFTGDDCPTHPKDPQAELRKAIETIILSSVRFGEGSDKIDQIIQLFQAREQQLLTELKNQLPKKRNGGSSKDFLAGRREIIDQVVEIIERYREGL